MKYPGVLTPLFAALAILDSGPAFAQHAAPPIDFGDDAGEWANDGECDDLRFAGSEMTDTPLLADDIGHDATDCHAGYRSGDLTLAPLFVRLEGANDILWGDDTSEWAKDGECDDLRFAGDGMSSPPLLADDIGHDGTDCRVAFRQGRIAWSGGLLPEENPADHISWGDDKYPQAENGVCDDMRFAGEGMSGEALETSAVKHDASDCRAAFEAGSIELRT